MFREHPHIRAAAIRLPIPQGENEQIGDPNRGGGEEQLGPDKSLPPESKMRTNAKSETRFATFTTAMSATAKTCSQRFSSAEALRRENRERMRMAASNAGMSKADRE